LDDEGLGSMRTIDDLDELVTLADGASPVYLRYSKGPVADERAGPSIDYESGVRLPGWAVTTISPEWWWDRPAIDWVARRVCKYLDLGNDADDTRPWVLSGSVVGRGPDHEPLVIETAPVAWLGERLVDAAREIYEARFDVGRDSA
jgi:hypothetical protein